jgi:5'-nucleotidase
MKTDKTIWFDLDDTMADFADAHHNALLVNPNQPYPQSQWGFFTKLKPIDGAIWAYFKLKNHFKVGILTRPSFRNINCYSEKAQWVLDNLGFDALENTILAGDKSLIKGDYLIDDGIKAGQEKFEGEFIRFGSEQFPNWETVVNYILEKEKI